jgi:hypothetical protein
LGNLAEFMHGAAKHGDKIRNADRMRLNTEEEIRRVHCDWYDTIFTRDLSALVAL